MTARSLRIALALVVLLGLSGLTPLAYASPPDPSWIRGIYDDADYDDIVVLITSGAAVTAPVLVVEIRSLPSLAGLSPQRTEGSVPTRPFSPLQSRAPPAC